MMESEVDRLAHAALADLDSQPEYGRVLIGIAGVPGSGKTTLAGAVASRINVIWSGKASNLSQGENVAIALPMDGFHLSRAQLLAMPNAEEAIHRRGAPFTFDGEGFLELVRSLRNDTGKLVLAPSFGHEIKDPVPDTYRIEPSAKIILIEGNYCALDEAPWKDAAALMTRLWYVDTPADISHARLAKRHLVSGIVADEKEAWERATGTDELNASVIRKKLLPVDERICVA